MWIHNVVLFLFTLTLWLCPHPWLRPHPPRPRLLWKCYHPHELLAIFYSFFTQKNSRGSPTVRILLITQKNSRGSPTVRILLNQKEPTVQQKQNKKTATKKEIGSLRRAGPNYAQGETSKDPAVSFHNKIICITIAGFKNTLVIYS